MAIQQNIIEKLVPGLSEADHKQNYLQAIAKEYPYYAAAQLAFLKEHSSNDLSIGEAKQRAALVWHPLVLEQLLLDGTATIEDDANHEVPTMRARPASEEEDEIEEVNLSDENHVPLEDDLQTNQEHSPSADEEITSDLPNPTKEKEESTEDKSEKPVENSPDAIEQTGSIMDIAAKFDNQTSPENAEVLSNWDQREKMETALADEMNEPFKETKVKNENLEIKNETPEVPVKEQMIFEPLHTSDYFASQGIKLTEEQIPTDKLGKQLKSFTEWLQTMKSIHPVNIDLKINLNQEVATLAEKSNLEKEVITESMAIAYMAQGKPQKAADIYEKLKLIYPHKSAYFAAELMKLQ